MDETRTRVMSARYNWITIGRRQAHRAGLVNQVVEDGMTEREAWDIDPDVKAVR